MEIKELYTEKGYIITSESYSRRCVFVATSLVGTIWKTFKIKTTITMIDNGDAKILDAVSEYMSNNNWLFAIDLIPREGSPKNIIEAQELIIKNTISTLFEIPSKEVDLNSKAFLDMDIFNFDDLEEEVNTLNILDFNKDVT